MKQISFKGYCNHNRHSGINTVKEIVNRYGSILEFKMFSDISISLLIEIQRNRIQDFYNELSNYMKMDECDIPEETSTAACIVFLNITFMQAKGDLKQEIPDVPG